MTPEVSTDDAKTESDTSEKAPSSFTQEQVNAFLAEQKRKLSESTKDYGDLKAKAKRLEELENASASDSERMAKKIAALEQERDAALQRTLRAEVAADKGVPAKLLSGSTREELEEAADALLEFRGAKKPDPVKSLTPGGETKPERSVAAGAAMFAAKKKPSQN